MCHLVSNWPVGLVVSGSDCYIVGRGFDAYLEQMFV